MEPKRTNRPLLVQGLKTMGLTLLLLFLGPFLLHAGLSNPDKPLHIPLVVVGIGVCGTAIYMGFRGIKIIMDSIFK
jgi:hypothetical protein